MWCLPTHKRPEKLQRLIDSLGDEDREEQVIVVPYMYEPRIRDYHLMTLPPRWVLIPSPALSCGDKLNWAFHLFNDESFYGFLSDDIQLATPNMLKPMRQAAESGRFAWPDDGVHGLRLATHPVCPGNLLRILKFWAHPDFPHDGLDVVLYKVATNSIPFEYFANFKLRTEKCDDETFREGRELSKGAIDRLVKWEHEEMQQLIDKVRSNYG
jgi:hypothetical protein